MVKPRPTIPPVIVVPLTLPHPEEPRRPMSVASNVNIQAVKLQWLVQWEVPDKYIEFWDRTTKLVLVENLTYQGKPYPSLKWDDRIDIDPTWANPGVIAHEVAHIQYSMLTEQRKQDFVLAYDSVIGAPLLVLLREQKPYCLTSMTEMHAECYRYLGLSMPAELKEFYPCLM